MALQIDILANDLQLLEGKQEEILGSYFAKLYEKHPDMQVLFKDAGHLQPHLLPSVRFLLENIENSERSRAFVKGIAQSMQNIGFTAQHILNLKAVFLETVIAQETGHEQEWQNALDALQGYFGETFDLSEASPASEQPAEDVEFEDEPEESRESLDASAPEPEAEPVQEEASAPEPQPEPEPVQEEASTPEPEPEPPQAEASPPSEIDLNGRKIELPQSLVDIIRSQVQEALAKTIQAEMDKIIEEEMAKMSPDHIKSMIETKLAS